jgi:hypothetical protein
MAKYLDLFPRILYKVGGNKYESFQTSTDITFRVAIIKNVLSNFSSYYEYVVLDGETPEILAEKVYGDPEAHWIILYANNIFDPQYDWPMNLDVFKKYIRNKYGSLEIAQTTWHHYNKVITRENITDNVITTTKFEINSANVATNLSTFTADLPYDTYESLEFGYSATNIVGGKTVIETVSRERVSNFDYELELNEQRRNIKIIKKEYYSQIINEFDTLTGEARNPNLRRLV